MAIFKTAIEELFKNEGGYNNIKEDKGGATNYGISLRFYQNNINANATFEDIKKLTKEQAEDIYFQYFWLKNNYSEINNQKLASKIFDVSVNMGETIANRFLQQSYNALNLQQIKIDGICGLTTINSINNCSNENIANMLEYIKILQKHHYLEIVKNRSDQQKFLKGWLNRADK